MIHKLLTYTTLLVTLVAAIGGCIQAWSSYKNLPADHVNAKTVPELVSQLESRKKNLGIEASNINQLLASLSTPDPKINEIDPTTTENIEILDKWWISGLKFIAVYFVFFVSILGAIIALFLDLITWVIGNEMVLAKGLLNALSVRLVVALNI